VEFWWTGATKETYLQQMQLLKSVVVQARRFNHAHAIETKASQKRSVLSSLNLHGEKSKKRDADMLAEQPRERLRNEDSGGGMLD
jgi:hypothetical protein